MARSQCGHFSLEVQELPLSGVPVVLRVPIRRCKLAERMVALLATQEAGHEVVRKIVISESLKTGGTGQHDKAELENLNIEALRVAFGPDLEAIHPHECTAQRCQDSCTPGFQALLRNFGFNEDASKETGTGCLESYSES